jgi:hypothetical protein
MRSHECQCISLPFPPRGEGKRKTLSLVHIPLKRTLARAKAAFAVASSLPPSHHPHQQRGPLPLNCHTKQIPFTWTPSQRPSLNKTLDATKCNASEKIFFSFNPNP